VVLLPPHQVRPYVTRNKTDRADAKGILAAHRNADIRPVPVESIPQQVLGIRWSSFLVGGRPISRYQTPGTRRLVRPLYAS
jgi:hypothetical protein